MKLFIYFMLFTSIIVLASCSSELMDNNEPIYTNDAMTKYLLEEQNTESLLFFFSENTDCSLQVDELVTSCFKEKEGLCLEKSYCDYLEEFTEDYFTSKLNRTYKSTINILNKTFLIAHTQCNSNLYEKTNSQIPIMLYPDNETVDISLQTCLIRKT